MKRFRGIMVLAAAASAAVMLLSACDYTVAGGGFFEDAAAPNLKVTVGADVTCNGPYGSGDVSFIDRDDEDFGRVSALGTAGYCGYFFIPGTYDLRSGIVGNYQPRPKGDGGAFYAIATDTGVTGPDKGDTLEVWLVGGEFDGYHFFGTLDGGNLTVTEF